MERICLEWNINCGNDAKNDYKDDHEVRTDHYKLENGEDSWVESDEIKIEGDYNCDRCGVLGSFYDGTMLGQTGSDDLDVVFGKHFALCNDCINEEIK